MAERSSVVQPGAKEPREATLERRAIYHQQNNLLRSQGAKALRIGLLWATCPASERGKYQTMLGRALRRMIEDGVKVPSKAQVERDIDKVLEGR